MKKKKGVVCFLVICLLAICLVFGVMLNTKQNVFAKNEDFRIEDGVLTAYVGSDSFISIPGEVRVIGEGAFAGNTTLQSIEMPDGLVEIQYNAFGDCTALTDVSIPDTCIKVGPGAFKGCSTLAYVKIGKSVSSWGSGVFNDCTSLSYLVLDDANLYLTYYDGALYNGDMSFLYQVLPGREGENYVTPEEVKEIDTYAFYNLKNIQNIKLVNVETIPAYSMSQLGSVQNVVLTEAVDTIEAKAFRNDANLQQIVIPEEILNIEDNAITKCEKASIYTTKDSTADKYGKENKIPVIYEPALATDFNDSNPSGQAKPNVSKKITINTVVDELPEKETTEEEMETEEKETEESVVEEDDESVIGRTIIVNGQAVLLMNNREEKVYFEAPASETEETEEVQESEETEESNETKDSETQEEEQTQETEADAVDKIEVTTTIPSNSNAETEGNAIAAREYYKDSSLTEFTIPDTVDTIGRLAFAKTGLTQIDIPESVKTIEYGAFYECKDLSKVNIPDTVADISTKAFAGTSWLESWQNGERGTGDFLIAGDHILLAYRGTADSVEIPQGVKKIGAEVFKGHEEIVYVDIPDSVTEIGTDAFRDCKSLTKVTGGDGLKKITKGAFYGTDISEDDLK